jgi:hypothetical protein
LRHVRARTPEDEDSRRLCRERKVLITERVQHVNRIKGLLFSQGISDYEPLRRNRRKRLDELKTGDDGPCRRIFGLRSAVNSIGLNCCSNRSRPSKRSGTPCSLRRRHKMQKNRPGRC